MWWLLFAEQRPGIQGTAPLAEEGPVMTSAAGTCLPSGGKSVPGISAEVCLELLLLLLLAGLPNGQPTSMQRGRPREPAAGTNGKRLPATRWSRGRIAFVFFVLERLASSRTLAPLYLRGRSPSPVGNWPLLSLASAAGSCLPSGGKSLPGIPRRHVGAREPATSPNGGR